MKRIVKSLAVTACALAICSSASMAAVTKLKSNGEVVPIYIDEQALKEAYRYIDFGLAARDPSRVYPYLACIVDVGTEVRITDITFFSHIFTVRVMSGPEAGKCAGTVKRSFIDNPDLIEEYKPK